MKYQLVIQFNDIDDDDFDELIDLEVNLIEDLTAEHDVDGHDFGEGEFTLFIFTNSPQSALHQINDILQRQSHKAYTVACRRVGEEDYTFLWRTNHAEDVKTH